MQQSFRIDGDPRPQPRPSVGRGGVYYRDPTGRYTRWVQALRVAFNGATPVVGPYSVRLEFMFTRPVSHRLRSGELSKRYRDAIPGWDVDNLAKTVLDELQRAGVLSDDRLVWHLVASKEWMPYANGVYVLVEGVDEETKQ